MLKPLFIASIFAATFAPAAGQAVTPGSALTAPQTSEVARTDPQTILRLIKRIRDAGGIGVAS